MKTGKAGFFDKTFFTKKVLAIAIAAIMVISVMMVIAPTAAVAQEEQVKTLRIYGNNSEGAAFPYTNPEAPFDPVGYTGEVPRKDFITFNPAYMDYHDGGFFQYLHTHDEKCLNEKVFLRQWYQENYSIPRGDSVLAITPECPESFVPAIVNEYTYMVLEWKTNNPTSDQQGLSFIFPNSVESLTDSKCGLDSYDVDSFSETLDEDTTILLWKDNVTISSPESKFNVTADANSPGTTDWVILSPCSWISGDSFRGTISLHQGESVTFLDHRVTLMSAGDGEVGVTLEFIGNCPDIGPTPVEMTLKKDVVCAAGRASVTNITYGEAESLNYSHPWYIIPKVIGDGTASFNIGRLLQEAESMFVDGMQYDVAAIYGPTNKTLKYITIRNPVLKEGVMFGCPGTCLCGYDANETLPVLPPFDRTHDIIDDIDIPNIGTGSDTFHRDNLGGDGTYDVYYRGEKVGDADHNDYLINDLDYIGFGVEDENERRAKDLPALNMYYVAETKEERFDTSILEILNETAGGEAWNWTNIETMPWNYTEMVYPTATVHYENSEYDDTNLDYLLTSSFIAPNSGIGERGNDVRVKFVYDPKDGLDDIYVNEHTSLLAKLRIYGEGNASAAFPYTNPEAPFDPVNYTGEVPEKDFVTFNPAYMDYHDGGFFQYLHTHDEKCLNEKVFLRQWYQENYSIPRGDSVLAITPECPESFVPAIVNEYTYMVLEWKTNNPTSDQQGLSFIFPNSVESLTDSKCGLDSYDVDSFSETLDEDTTILLWKDNVTISSPESKFNVTADANSPGTTDWVILSPCSWISGDSFRGTISLHQGESVTFLDHRVTLMSAGDGEVGVTLEFIGNCPDIGPTPVEMTLKKDVVCAAGRASVTNITYGEAESLNYSHPWYIIPKVIGDGTASFNIGRLLQEAESMFVDGMQYDVAAIYGPTNKTLKYITIRNPVLKEGVMFGCPGTCLCGYDANETLPVLPPFDRTHDIIDDIDIPNIGTGSDTFHRDNLGGDGTYDVYYRGEKVGDADHNDYLINDLDYIGFGVEDENERRAKDLPALNMYYVAETKEERFDTSILEILNETAGGEAWNWTNIETMPWNYTEMVYPTATVHYENSEYDDTNLDYLLTSSFIAPNSGIGERGNDVRVKFVYDPKDGTGIYVNTAGPVPARVIITDLTAPEEDILKGTSFTVTATVSNTGTLDDATGVEATITLPAGLSTAEATTKGLGTISAGDSKNTSWNVDADEVGDYTITVDVDSDNAGSDSGSVSVSVTEEVVRTPGDVNDDTEINIQDAVLLFNWVSFPAEQGTTYVLTKPENANVNGDTETNIQDAVLLFNYVSFPAEQGTTYILV